MLIRECRLGQAYIIKNKQGQAVEAHTVFPDAFSSALIISRTEYPIPLPKLYVWRISKI